MTDENESNEHDDDQPHVHAVFPFQIGPTAEQIEQARMGQEAAAHDIRGFFESLNAEQLVILRGILNHADNTDGKAAIYYQGLVAGYLDLKHNQCLVCGNDHTKVPEDFFDEQPEQSAQVPTDVGTNVCCATQVGYPHEYQCPLMLQYNMEPDDDGSERVMCKGCNKWYVSLDDRMLRAPGVTGCEGCIEKQKWG